MYLAQLQQMEPGKELLHKRYGLCELREIQYSRESFFGVVIRPKTETGKDQLALDSKSNIPDFLEDSLRNLKLPSTKLITARYTNCGNGNFGGFALAVVLVVNETPDGEVRDWTAYWGATPGVMWKEEDTIEWVANNGNKLSTRDAAHFSQGEELPMRLYRH